MHRWQHVRSSMENDSVLFRTRLSKRDSFFVSFFAKQVSEMIRNVYSVDQFHV